MAFKFFNPAPVLFGTTGVLPIPGGSVTFYAKGTSTLKATYSNQALTTTNPNPVPIGTDGRLAYVVWMEGEYTVVIKDSGGTVVHTDDMTDGNPAGTTLPSPVGQTGKALLSNGSAYVLSLLTGLPDPTGAADQYLKTDGVNWFPAALTLPDLPNPDIVVAAGKLQAGVSSDPNKTLLLWGTDSAPAAGSSKTTSKAISFATAFSATPSVLLLPTNANSSGVVPHAFAASISTSGFTATFSTLTGGTSADSYTASNISSAIGFCWVAVGNRTVS